MAFVQNYKTFHRTVKVSFWHLFYNRKVILSSFLSSKSNIFLSVLDQKSRSSTAVAEDLRPRATATVAEVLGHSYGRRFFFVVYLVFFPKWRLKCVFH